MNHAAYWQAVLGNVILLPLLASEWARCIGLVADELAKALSNVHHVLERRTYDPTTFETCVDWARTHIAIARTLLTRLAEISPSSGWTQIIDHELELLSMAGGELDSACLYRNDALAANGFLTRAERHIQAAIAANDRIVAKTGMAVPA